MKEEKQIQEFVHRVFNDETLRQELASNPQRVIGGLPNCTPRVSGVLLGMAPVLAGQVSFADVPSFSWWIKR